MMNRSNNYAYVILTSLFAATLIVSSSYAQDDDSSRTILKQGLVGAGSGALAAGMSGGKAGQGALIGAGTSIIGSALLDALTGPSQTSSRRRAAPPPQDDYYYTEEPEEYYEAPPQESGSTKILKQGLVGAGTGALASGMSGGNAGQGAIIGAGTNVIGNALLDTLTQPTEQRKGRAYRKIPRQQTQVQEDGSSDAGTRKKIIRKYDDSGKVVSEEEIYY